MGKQDVISLHLISITFVKVNGLPEGLKITHSAKQTGDASRVYLIL